MHMREIASQKACWEAMQLHKTDQDKEPLGKFACRAINVVQFSEDPMWANILLKEKHFTNQSKEPDILLFTFDILNSIVAALELS